MIHKSQFQTATLVIKLGNAVTWIKNYKTQFMGLTAPQSEAISYILKNVDKKELTASHLMEHLQLSQSTVTGIIQRLEGKGLITRTTAENDSRKSIITPTEKGLELEGELRKKAVETEAIILEGMSESEKEEFNRLLKIALNNAVAIREKGDVF